MEWTEEAIAKLRTLWAEGLSTAEIGRRLNISKNAENLLASSYIK